MPDDGLRRFLHQAHVFGSAVQEILEAKYLRDASELPLSVAQFNLLKLIALKGEHQVGEVAEFLGVSSPAASKSLDKLEGLGLVARCPSPGDRRVTLLVATDAGHALVRQYEDTKAQRLGPVIARLGPSDTEDLTRLLERFSTLLFRSEAAAMGFCLRCAAYGDVTCTLRAGTCPYERTPNGAATAAVSREDDL